MVIKAKIKQPNKIITNLHLIIVWLIGIILVLVPLLFTQSIFIGLIFPKTMLFYSLTTILIIIYSILIYFDRQFIPRLSKIGWIFLALILAFTLSTIFSSQPYTSIWGAFNRMDGLLTWFYYLAFFIIVSGITRYKNSWQTILKIAISGIIIISIYAIYKLWFIDDSSIYRAESSLGNPVFLGGYLAMSIPLALSYILNKKYSVFKVISFLALILGVIALFYTFSRGSWIAAFLAILLVFGLYFYKYGRQIFNLKVIKIISGIVLLLIIIIALSYLNSPNSKILKNNIISTTSIEHRLHTWSVGLQAFKEKPIIGWGLENFRIGFNNYYTSSSKSTYVPFQETHVDRAHNGYIDIAVTGGIIALMIYLLIIFLSLAINLKQIFKSLTKNKSSQLWITIGFAGSILAYAIYVMTAFHLVVNILWLLLALAWTNNLILKSTTPSTPNISFKIISPIIIIVAITLSYYSIIKPVLAVNAANQGTIEFHQGRVDESLNSFKQSLSYKSFVSNPIRAQMVTLVTNNLTDNREEVLNNFRNYINEIIDNNFITEPYHNYYHMIFGIYYGELSNIYPEFLKRAEYHFQKSVQLSPGNGEAYIYWGKMYINLNNKVEAKIKLDKALSLTSNNRDLYILSGLFYISIGETDNGILFIQKAIDLEYDVSLINIEELLNIVKNPEEIQKVKQFYLDITSS